MPQFDPSNSDTCVSLTFFGKDCVSTANPWFMDVISTFPVESSLTGWLAPWCPWFILIVFAPRASASIWCPKHIPKIGISLCSNMPCIIGTAYFPVAAGSPGPLERKTPCGL